MTPRLLAPVILLLVGCNSVFYQPDRIARTTPAMLGLRYEDLTIRTDDGVRLAAWHISPRTETSTDALGTIIHFHGNAQNMTTHFHYVVWLAEAGYRVVTFDYRGYGESEGVPSREGLFLDGKAVLETVDRHPELGRGPRFVVGQSLGGAVAVPAVALHDKEPIDGLILDSTFGSYRSIAQDKVASFFLTWPLQWPLSLLVGDSYSAVDYIERIEAPILFLHSREDPVVPYSEGLELYEAARETGRNAELWSLDEPGHTVAMRPASPVRQRILEWLERVRNRSRRSQTPPGTP